MPHFPEMTLAFASVDEATDRAVLIWEGFSRDEVFAALRNEEGTWSDAALPTTPAPGIDDLRNFSMLESKEAETLSKEALAALSSLKPMRAKSLEGSVPTVLRH